VLCTAMVSAITGRKAKTGIAMTGEITLLGRVLPVGGLKEKVLAANRAELTTVILPADNQHDLEEVPLEARTHMIFAPVTRIDQVLQPALEDQPEQSVDDSGNGGQRPPGSIGPPGPSSIESEAIQARPKTS
jgi:ATP-dependent Lon protease